MDVRSLVVRCVSMIVLLGGLGTARANPVAVDIGTFKKPTGAATVATKGEAVLLVPLTAGGEWTVFMGTDATMSLKITGSGTAPLKCDLRSFVPTAPASPANLVCVSTQVKVVKACGEEGWTCPVRTGTMYYGSGPGAFVTAPVTAGMATCSAAGLKVTDPSGGDPNSCFALPAPYAAKAPVTAVPAGAVACGNDGAVCRVPDGMPVTIYYGAGKKFAVLSGEAGDFTCLPGNLGVEDPAPNVTKTCSIVMEPSRSYKACAVDGGTCSPSKAWVGFYGAGMSYVAIAGQATAFTCLDSALNVPDPAPNVQKQCFIRAQAAPVPPPSTTPAPLMPAGSKCADEGGSCSFNPTVLGQLYRAYYGIGDTWMVKTVPLTLKMRRDWSGITRELAKTTTFDCNNAWFGADPAVGKRKVCYLEDTGIIGD